MTTTIVLWLVFLGGIALVCLSVVWMLEIKHGSKR